MDDAAARASYASRHVRMERIRKAIGMSTDSPVGFEARTYYAVPTNYSIGSEHDDLAEAVAAAKATMRRYFYPGHDIPGEFPLGSYRNEDDGVAFYSRAFVDRRVKSAKSDEPVERIEVFLTDAEKDALAEAA